MSTLLLFLVTYLGLDSMALPVLAHSGSWLWLVRISDEGSLPEIALSALSKLASTYFTLSVHVLYTEIEYCTSSHFSRSNSSRDSNPAQNQWMGDSITPGLYMGTDKDIGGVNSSHFQNENEALEIWTGNKNCVYI